MNEDPPQPEYALPVWAEVGALLEGLGEYIQHSAPTPAAERYGSYLEAIGKGISTSDFAADTAIGGASAAEIAGAARGRRADRRLEGSRFATAK